MELQQGILDGPLPPKLAEVDIISKNLGPLFEEAGDM